MLIDKDINGIRFVAVSYTHLDVYKRQAKRFGGGGHVHAAGYTDNGSVEEIRNRAVEYAAKLLK